MLTVTLSLIVLCQLTDLVISTRLPLEVYEIHQSSSASVVSPSSSSSQSLQVFELNNSFLKQKSSQTSVTNSGDQLDRRRSRQMLDILQKQQHQSVDQNELRDQQKFQHVPTKILYQIGESEDDLPICAPNAVCSKIDLYETPWIERQCRCPEINRIPTVILHHKDPYLNHEKSHNYYESEKLLQRKRLLDFSDTSRRFESIHLKKLMQRLGAVYQDDIELESEEDVLDDSNAFDIHDNEFPTHRSVYNQSPGLPLNKIGHIRHYGHNNHRTKEISFIGGCPSSLGIEDGHTIVDKTRHYKLCNPIHKLPVCRHFRDFTWTLTTSAETNVTEQIVHCRCPRNSVTYLTKREPQTDGVNGYTYLFACSPLTRIRCQRKEPCKLFTVRKRQEFLDEVNINALCQCPKAHHCPSHHTNSGVIPGETFIEDNIQTYSGYCMAND